MKSRAVLALLTAMTAKAQPRSVACLHPIGVTLVSNPNGSQSITGTSLIGGFGDPAINGEDHYAAVSGMAFADAGVLRVG